MEIVAARLVILLVGMMLRGITLAWMWQWFMVPLGLPTITGAHALGLAVLASFPTTRIDDEELRNPPSVNAAFANGVLLPLLAIGIGWFIVTAMRSGL